MIRVAVLTVSDSAVRGTREDLSGPALVEHCRNKGWSVTAHEAVQDERNIIASRLRSWADENIAALILTTGGTGVAPRDVTPEATADIIERQIPGLPEVIVLGGSSKRGTQFCLVRLLAAAARASSLIFLVHQKGLSTPSESLSI